MKQSVILLSIFLFYLTGGRVPGQASFWLNNVNPNVDAPVFDAGGTPLYGTDYLVELWGSSSSNSLSPALTYYSSQRLIIPFTHSPGYFFHGGGGDDVLVISDAPPAGWAWLEVRAWDARLGATYEEVSALDIGGYGESPLFYARGNLPGQSLPEIPAELVGLESFSLRPIVPEPSTFALAALGATALLVFRWHR